MRIDFEKVQTHYQYKNYVMKNHTVTEIQWFTFLHCYSVPHFKSSGSGNPLCPLLQNSNTLICALNVSGVSESDNVSHFITPKYCTFQRVIYAWPFFVHIILPSSMLMTSMTKFLGSVRLWSRNLWERIISHLRWWKYSLPSCYRSLFSVP